MHIWGYINAFGTTTFTLFSFFKRELMSGTWINANHFCHMALVAKPERDSAKYRYKLIDWCKFNNIFDRGTGKMIKNDRRFTIHITSTVQKMLRTCTGKQTIEGVPVLESLSTIFHYSTVVCLQHQPWIFSSPYYSMCAASNLYYLGDCSSPKIFFNVWDGEAPVEWNSIICFP